MFANDTNRVRGAVLCLSQDGACTNLFENFSENNLKGDLSNDTTDNPPLFSLVNTFKVMSFHSGDPPEVIMPGCGCVTHTAWLVICHCQTYLQGRLTCPLPADDTSLYPSAVPKRYWRECKEVCQDSKKQWAG